MFVCSVLIAIWILPCLTAGIERKEAGWKICPLLLGAKQVSTCKVPIVFVVATYLSQMIVFFTA